MWCNAQVIVDRWPWPIRTYEPGDHDRIWEMHREGVRDSRAQYPDVDNTSYEDDLRNIERDYLSPGANFWVAEATGGS